MDTCIPGKGWDEVAHRFLTAAAQGAEQADSLPAGLFTGLGGMAFTVSLLSRDGTRYQRLLEHLETALAPLVLSATARLRDHGQALSVNDFDVISGAAGLGAYLMHRDARGNLRQTLAGLTALAEENGDVPRWFTPPEFLGSADVVEQYPHGNLNCGLAHGIPGPLAVLALAYRDGVSVSGQREAIRRLADWLVAHRVDDEWGINWPTAIPLSRTGEPDGEFPALATSRAAWCYGSPGIARALWLAGEALEDAALGNLAVEAIVAVLRRPISERRIDSPTFCHGVAGLLQIVLRFANDTRSNALIDAANELVEQLLAAYDADRPLGYASLESHSNWVDRTGLLDGAPGVAMALLAAASDNEPGWDRIFLLS